MTCLLYCILNGRRGPARPSVTGVRGQTLWMLECEGLCAAVSQAVPQDGGAAPLDDLIAYVKAVEAFNRCETVVPMRYGCRFAGAAQVRHWMRGCAAQLRSLLRRVDGCMEMGVRAIPVERPAPASEPGPAHCGGSGLAYLAARRMRMARLQHCDRIAQMVSEALAGTYRQYVRQVEACGQIPMASLYFLVERSRIGAFRDGFARMEQAGAALMLSGPWPPYNFVRDLPGSRGCAALELES